MATIDVDGDILAVTLTRGEKVAGLHGDVRVPLTAVRQVEVVADGLAAVGGMRAPGLAIPGRTKIGTWRSWGHRRLVVARKGVPAVRVHLDGDGPDELVVSTPQARAVAERVRAAAGLPGPAARST